jgi:integrase
MLDSLIEAKRVRDAMWPDQRAVFIYDGERLGSINKAWDKACKRAGFDGLHFHDLRRSANRMVRDKGLPQSVRMKVMGHRTASMTCVTAWSIEQIWTWRAKRGRVRSRS